MHSRSFDSGGAVPYLSSRTPCSPSAEIQSGLSADPTVSRSAVCFNIMASTTVPYTITYRHQGTEPPLFLAGTFTTVQWGLQEMGCSRDEGGEYVFESRVFVEPGREYQFKFKAGQHGPWILDEDKTIGLFFLFFFLFSY